jgi:hypothetical protein
MLQSPARGDIVPSVHDELRIALSETLKGLAVE